MQSAFILMHLSGFILRALRLAKAIHGGGLPVRSKVQTAAETTQLNPEWDSAQLRDSLSRVAAGAMIGVGETV